MSYRMKWNLDETSTLNAKFHSIVLSAFNLMTHRELVIMPREFYPHKTHFISLFLNKLSCLCGNLINANETHIKLPLRLVLEVFVCFPYTNAIHTFTWPTHTCTHTLRSMWPALRHNSFEAASTDFLHKVLLVFLIFYKLLFLHVSFENHVVEWNSLLPLCRVGGSCMHHSMLPDLRHHARVVMLTI